MSIVNNSISANFIGNNIDLCPYYSGIEVCDSGHDYGPAVRDHFLIHYIFSGKGTFETGNKVYELGEGQGFLIHPGIVTYYKADVHEPWTYAWVGFQGMNADSYLQRANLTEENPVFTYNKDDKLRMILKQMIEAKDLENSKDIRFTSLLYLFLSELIEALEGRSTRFNNKKRSEFYVRATIKYIQMNYSRDVKIEEIAHHIGIERKYLSAVFNKVLGISPQKYLINFRMNKACELINSSSFSISDISRSVGYNDPLLFSKIFKKVKGLSPREFRQGQAIGR